jgi:putative ABC transport system permease protein
MAQLVTYALYHWVLKLDFTLNLALFFIIPIASALLIGLAGLWGTRSVVNQSPMQVLREL